MGPLPEPKIGQSNPLRIGGPGSPPTPLPRCADQKFPKPPETQKTKAWQA